MTFADFLLLVACILQVESHGDDLARGRAGERGAYQITAIALRDVRENFPGRYPYTLADMDDRRKCQAVAVAYLVLNRHRYYLEHGRDPSVEWLAKSYNGGPNWDKKGVNVRYRLDNYFREINLARVQILKSSNRNSEAVNE